MDKKESLIKNDYQDVQKLIAENLRRIRKERGWSQEKLAAFSDIDRSYIGFVENCKYNVSVKVLCELAKALEVDITSFFVIENSKSE